MKNIYILTLLFLLFNCENSKTNTEISQENNVLDNTIELSKAQFESQNMKLGEIEKHSFKNTIKTSGFLDVPPQNKASVISFTVDGIHPFDIGTLLDQLGIAIRTGHHCTQPLMKFFNIPGTAKASFAFYNKKSEIDFFIDSLKLIIILRYFLNFIKLYLLKKFM